ncbi:hypothetical protein KFE25_009398 [Diacronema lutheri]|uniref:Uncharacterized protein n=1 Tax=Diacronema lutheri TaxID=2081491 RepID=A0A8J6CDG5_DIALT|nr:hypothetical protein KFE25_009398 [Diacronema lutheri]
MAAASSEREATGGVRILDGESYVASVSEQTTGGEIWPAARALLAFLLGAGRSIVPARARCLELGSGTGWLGMVLAAGGAAPEVCEVVLSEYGGGLAWLRLNVGHNYESFKCPVGVVECDWDWFAPRPGDDAPVARGSVAAQIVERGPWDLVFGSDLVYNDAGVHGLPCCLAALARGGCPCILYAHTLHRFDNCDVEFFLSLHRNGMVYRELATSEAHCDDAPSGTAAPRAARPPSPPPFSELFPEQRPAIFRIATMECAHLLGGPAEDRHSAALRAVGR